MERIILLTLFSLFFSASIAQEYGKSYIYNENGTLKADTSLKISPTQFLLWKEVENNIVGAIASKVKYPEMAKDAGITGLAIIAFDCDTHEVKNIIQITEKIGGGIEESLAGGVKEAGPQILRQLKFAAKFVTNEEYAYIGRYYIPVDFSLIHLMTEVKNKKAVPVMGASIPLISKIVCGLAPPDK